MRASAGVVMSVKFPGSEDHVAVIGRNGSGKSTFAAWLLSGCNFDAMSWTIVNTKGDAFIEEIAAIPGVKTIGINDTPGRKGLYVINPLPHEQDELNEFFHRCWEMENNGLWIDEGYSIQKDDWFKACLTQGRSKRVPLIVLSQRPAWISKYVFSECNFVSLFNLQIRDDRKKVAEFVPVEKEYRLQPYCSYWYNVKDNDLREFGPVPNNAAILKTFRAKFPPEQAQAPVVIPARNGISRRPVV